MGGEEAFMRELGPMLNEVMNVYLTIRKELHCDEKRCACSGLFLCTTSLIRLNCVRAHTQSSVVGLNFCFLHARDQATPPS